MCPTFVPAEAAVAKVYCANVAWNCTIVYYGQFRGSYTMSVSRALYDRETIATTAAEGIIGNTEKFYVIAPPDELIFKALRSP